jgi:hypothetical protein
MRSAPSGAPRSLRGAGTADRDCAASYDSGPGTVAPAGEPYGIDGGQGTQLVGDHPDAADPAVGEAADVDDPKGDLATGGPERAGSGGQHTGLPAGQPEGDRHLVARLADVEDLATQVGQRRPQGGAARDQVDERHRRAVDHDRIRVELAERSRGLGVGAGFRGPQCQQPLDVERHVEPLVMSPRQSSDTLRVRHRCLHDRTTAAP